MGKRLLSALILLWIIGSTAPAASEDFTFEINTNFIICGLAGPAVKETPWYSGYSKAFLNMAVPQNATVYIRVDDKSGNGHKLTAWFNARNQEFKIGCKDRYKCLDVTQPFKFKFIVHCKDRYPHWYNNGCDMRSSSISISLR